MTEVTFLDKADLLKRDRLAAHFAHGGSIRAGKGREEIVKGAVLLYDDDDVLNWIRGGADRPGMGLPRHWGAAAYVPVAATGCKTKGRDERRAAAAYI
jgi:hypothetical protein